MTIRYRVMLLLVAAEVLLILLLGATVLPEPTGATSFRVHAYVTHLLWFPALGWFVVQLEAARLLPLGIVLRVLFGLFVLAMVGNLLELPYVTDVLKVAFGGIAGHAFIRAVERPWWLVPIGVCVPLADIWSVFSDHGVTNAVVDKAAEEPAWIDWPTIATPVAGLPYDLFGRMGIVDVLFLGLFVGAAQRWGLGVPRVLVACTAGFLATSVLVFEGADVAIPVLPMLCIAFLVACAPALWRDARAEWVASR